VTLRRGEDIATAVDAPTAAGFGAAYRDAVGDVVVVMPGRGSQLARAGYRGGGPRVSGLDLAASIIGHGWAPLLPLAVGLTRREAEEVAAEADFARRWVPGELAARAGRRLAAALRGRRK
jgi:hypothetical protein